MCGLVGLAELYWGKSARVVKAGMNKTLRSINLVTVRELNHQAK